MKHPCDLPIYGRYNATINIGKWKSLSQTHQKPISVSADSGKCREEMRSERTRCQHSNSSVHYVLPHRVRPISHDDVCGLHKILLYEAKKYKYESCLNREWIRELPSVR
ncbi:hypothetical protein KIN20_022094 [Parelaphostrongylus tenuis]|uniref:Uncharacterized protein n=1 Tax=Parelaphostrongylus tenuis TaxID=148309 RepID=A0AAD5N5V5_PARTN|nr:hypothetical protein KIN20_022094 [Parelaphostrongylus tenuis]